MTEKMTHQIDQMQTPKGRRLIAKARETNAIRDAGERAAGWAAPRDDSLFLHLRTVESALVAGLDGQDWHCIAEGAVMLSEAIQTVRDREGARGEKLR